MTPLPSHCTVESSGYCHAGTCHAFGVDAKGPYALIEYESGQVTVVYLNDCWSVKLLPSP